MPVRPNPCGHTHSVLKMGLYRNSQFVCVAYVQVEHCTQCTSYTEKTKKYPLFSCSEVQLQFVIVVMKLEPGIVTYEAAV